MAKTRILVIMAGGASSRMKRSLSEVPLDEKTRDIAQHNHKSLIPFGERNLPLLYYHFRLAKEAGVEEVFIITPVDNDGFTAFIAGQSIQSEFRTLTIHLIPQTIPEGRDKPLGTADAVAQALIKNEQLRSSSFVVMNGDNLYSKGVLEALFSLPESQQALIGYAREGLRFSAERIQKFAVLQYDAQHALTQMIEKPTAAEVEHAKDPQGKVRVSMNIFKLFGPVIQPFLEQCPLHPIRQEKELPVAIQRCIQENPTAFLVIPRNEHVPDLTSAEDIEQITKQIS